MSDLIKIAGLWKNESKTSGKRYLGGKCEQEITIPAGAKFFIFENTPKDGQELHPKAPNFQLMVEGDQTAQDVGGYSGGSGGF